MHSSGGDRSALCLPRHLTREGVLVYVTKRSAKNGAERFTGLYRTVDGTYKSAGTFSPNERAFEVAEAADRHVRLQLAGTSPADKATITVEAYADIFLSSAAIEANSKETYALT